MKFRKQLVRGAACAAVAAALALAVPGSASADEYNRYEAGHPLRMAAYILHPIGVFFDYMILRPAHWVGSHEPVAAVFGHQLDLEERDHRDDHDH